MLLGATYGQDGAERLVDSKARRLALPERRGIDTRAHAIESPLRFAMIGLGHNG
jgi:hypothetical protein